MALTPTQQALLLFKKLLGKGSSDPVLDFYEESKNARPIILPSQVWNEADLIPSTAPGASAGVVDKYVDEALSVIPGTNSRAYYSSSLVDAIPFNHGDGTSYNYTVKDSLGNAIAFGVGDWVVDPDAGTLTFYGTVPSNMPPTISFWKYVGVKGVGVGGGSLLDTIPLGAILAYAGTAAPTNYLMCDGTAVSRTTYAALYTKIGTTHGSGDGSTTFNLPDMRGRFIRGRDGGAGRDPDAATRSVSASGGSSGDNVGSAQGDDVGGHDHDVTDPGHVHSLFVSATKSQAGMAAGANVVTATGSVDVTSDLTGVTIDATGNGIGSETRPINIYENFIIKAVDASAGTGSGNLPTVTGTRASPILVNAAGGIAPIGDPDQMIFVAGDSAPINITANPQIAAGVTVGDRLELHGCSDTDTLLVEDGTGLKLNGPALLAAYSVIGLGWDGTNWCERYRR